jgi:hypothetical protein
MLESFFSSVRRTDRRTVLGSCSSPTHHHRFERSLSKHPNAPCYRRFIVDSREPVSSWASLSTRAGQESFEISVILFF